MNRRAFLGVGAGVAAGLLLPRPGAASGPRILIRDFDWIKLYKGGQQHGLVYWTNLDTKQYRRLALEIDFANGPYDGGRIVRHPYQANASKITYAPIGHLPTRTYLIEGYPVVPYSGLMGFGSKVDWEQGALTVEGTFDQAYLKANAPAWVREAYPDLPVR